MLYSDSSDLLTFEEILADLSDDIIIIVESPGTFCELGAFSSEKKYLEKLIIINEDRDEYKNSFITKGPIKKLQIHNIDNVILHSGKEFIDSSLHFKQTIQALSNKPVKIIPNSDPDNLDAKMLMYELTCLIELFQPIDMYEVGYVYKYINEFENYNIRNRNKNKFITFKPLLEQMIKLKMIYKDNLYLYVDENISCYDAMFDIERKDFNDFRVRYINRVILHPSKDIKVMQYWVCKNIFNEFPVSKFSMAYSKGDSITKNALKHRNSNYILHTDIINFFNNITREKISSLFSNNPDIVEKLDLSEQDIIDILNIVLYKGERLVIGSVASPLISNCIMYTFDNKLYNMLAKDFNIIYTRYSDDIIISSDKYIDDKIIDVIDELLKDEGFNRNVEKTYFMNKSSRRLVTGVVLDNNTNKLSIGSNKYRCFKRDLYNFLVKDIGDINKIRGFLSYITSVDRNQYNKLKDTYIKYDKKGILFEE